jgi:hypothetical protein
MGKYRNTTLGFCVLVLLTIASQYSAGQTYTTNVTTWHQDIPAICTGCVYRTGQNLSEGAITIANVPDTTFGQHCSYDLLDGQVYGQPLVVTNVTINGANYGIVVYVVTMNGTVYAFDGDPQAPISWPAGQCTYGTSHTVGPIASQSVLGSASPASCANLGGTNCQTIAPNVGILGTPVISTKTLGDGSTGGTLYLVVESQSGTPITWSHKLWALDITFGAAAVQVLISPPSGASPGCYGFNFSQLHIQRPALLLGGDNYLYIAFSMMDGYPAPLPNGMMLAYNTVGLSVSSLPLCLPMSEGNPNADGAGIWGGGGGPSYGTDSATGHNYFTFFNTGNGVFDLNTTGGIDAGDSFIKMSNSGSALSIADYFTPGDQYWRSNKDSVHAGCSADGDVDVGSGSPMLVPDVEDSSHSFLAVSGDKEGGIWFVDRASPGKGGTTATCTGSPNTNLQTYPINGTAFALKTGPLIHTNPAFWESGDTTGTNYLFLGSSAVFSVAGAGELMRYQICNTGLPINTSTGCTKTAAYAYEVSGTPLVFPWGTTPSVSRDITTDTDAIVWTIWADGSVIPNSAAFTWDNNNNPLPHFPAATPGQLIAFEAAKSGDPNMPKLYSSEDCIIGGVNVDRINPATKYSVPTVADGHVYVGTQGPLVDPANNTQCSPIKNPTAACFNRGTFYVFGNIGLTVRTCS